MTIEKMATVIAVSSLERAVEVWSVLLETKPTFVDGRRWAQFDTPAGRVALAAGSEAEDGGGLMMRTSALAEVHDRLRADGLEPSPIEHGDHEQRFVVRTDGMRVIFYSPL